MVSTYVTVSGCIPQPTAIDYKQISSSTPPLQKRTQFKNLPNVPKGSMLLVVCLLSNTKNRMFYKPNNRILGKFTKNGRHDRMSRYQEDSLLQYFVCAIYSGHVIVLTKFSYKMLQAKWIEASNVISNKPSNRVQIFILILF